MGFTEERMAGLARRRTLVAQCQGGPLNWKPNLKPEGLFGKDLLWFRERVSSGKPCYYDEEQMIQILGALENLAKHRP